MIHNPEIDLAFDFVQNTNRNIFLTGKAGTGKTTFLHKLKEISPKRMVVVAPTGVAAINAGGVTIHSFFQMPFGPILPDSLMDSENNVSVKKFNKKKINIIRTLDLLVIDEISMVRADLLDGVDQVLRRYKNPRLPFGGSQVLMIGDLQQLAPVVKGNEWDLLRNHFDTIYFFSSKVFQQANVLGIELKHIYRQQDNNFITILNEIRDNRLSENSLTKLNARYQENFRPGLDEGYITLTTHNAIANRINDEKLESVKAKVHSFKAEIKDNFPEYSYPTDEVLRLKIAAQVMFVKNDSSPEKRYYNGKIGTVSRFDEHIIYVKCPDENEPIAVEPEIWENIRYSINEKTKAIEEEVTGSFTQYPLRLAWAITIHKSQGLTFEKAVIDAQAAFAHGQTYVALSRCKTLEGLVLGSRLNNHAIITDQTVGAFNKQVNDNPPDQNTLADSKKDYVLSLLEELFSFYQIEYYIKKALQQTGVNLSIIHGNVQAPLTKMQNGGTQILNDVSKKFASQLRQVAETQDNDLFQIRIKKASAYFLEQTDLLLWKPLEKISFDTDNRLVKKDLKEAFSKIKELLSIKIACLKNTIHGFNTKDYLEVRAFAALEKVEVDRVYESGHVPNISSNPILYKRLSIWRNSKAEEQDVPAYFLFSQKALIGISNELPATSAQLKNIKGIGPKKIIEYGEAILEMVTSYCTENNILLKPDQPGTKKTQEKTPTRIITKALWDSGKSIEEIANERSLTQGTIEGHLAYFVGLGLIAVEKFVDPKKIKAVVDIINKNPDAGMSAIKGILGESVSWSDLRFISQHLNHLKEKI